MAVDSSLGSEKRAQPPAPPAPTSALRETSFLPVLPYAVPTTAQRQQLRAYTGTLWDRHAMGVQRALTRLPGLRASEDEHELSADFTAVHCHVNSDERRFTEARLRSALSHGDSDTVAYLTCLASGLRHLPSFRGTALRMAGVLGDELDLLVPGEEVGEPVPVGAVAAHSAGLSRGTDHYLISSVTGRKVNDLAGADNPLGEGGILFAPGTRFRVLEVLRNDGARLVLLRELVPRSMPAGPGRLDDADHQAIERLRDAVDQLPVQGVSLMPAMATGVLGVMSQQLVGGAPH